MKDPIMQKWNDQQKALRPMLNDESRHEQAIQVFLEQHAMVHAGEISSGVHHSFADALFADLSEEYFRRLPQNCEHSIAWCIFHIARIEDMTMNILLVGNEQVFTAEGWQNKLNANITHSANAMSEEEIIELSQALNINALLEYRNTVGQRTRQIVQQLQPGQLKQKISFKRIEQLHKIGAILPEAKSITDYWSKRTLAGLLLMPPTRHNFVHINESVRLKKRKK